MFCKSDTSLKLKRGNFSMKTGQNKGLTTLSKSLVAISKLQCDVRQHEKLPYLIRNCVFRSFSS